MRGSGGFTGRFAGRVAVVTGASRGIGLAIAARLLDEGAHVVLTARSEDGLAAARETLAERVGERVGERLGERFGTADRILTVAGRADDAAHRRAAIGTAVDRFGGLDVLVNNAGINPLYGPLADLDLDAARKVLEVNALGTLGWTQEALAAGLGDRPGAAVLNLSSVTGRVPSPGIGWYGVSKAAVSHLTATLSVELAPRVRVNALAPAVVKTRFARALYEHDEPGVAARYPLGRLGEPEDAAAAAAFLCSDEAAWITGQVLTLDGGLLTAGGVA